MNSMRIAIPESRRTVALLAGLQAIYWAAHAGVKSTNFAGIDEWPVIDLASRGIVAFPYANRLLSLLWVLPAHWITPHGLDGFRILSGLYVSLTGLAVFWLCRRLVPESTRLAFLAGAFAMLWAPNDSMRISTVQGTVHLGFAFGATLAIALLVESWTRRSRAVLVAAGAVSLATILSYEAVLPLLLLAPLLLPLRDREGRIWGAAWSAFVVAGAVIALSPGPGHSHDYQAELGADIRPALIVVRIGMQFWLHLAPLFFGFPAPGANAVIPVLIVVAVAAMSGNTLGREGAGPRRLLAAGFVGAVLAYAPYALTPGVVGATRTQIVSAPWIGILLASAIELVARRCGPARTWVAAAMGAWIVFLGASHVTKLQTVWDRFGTFPAQRASLLQLFAKVPDVKPHTLIVLVGDTQRSWPMSWGFRHAMAYFYEERAAGLVAGAKQEPYPATFGPEGVAVTPWPQIREAWSQPATAYGYDEVIVAVISSSGSIEVSKHWPEGGALPALPAQAVYEPSARIVHRDPRIATREILN